MRIVYGDILQKPYYEQWIDSKKKRRMKEARKAKNRIVIFGNGPFGHGSRGPSPRKVVIRAIGKLCPVLIVDIFRTSKMCHNCGQAIKKIENRVQHCGNKLGGDSDSIYPVKIGRDINGGANMGYIGMCELCHLPRPEYLRRPKKNNAD